MRLALVSLAAVATLATACGPNCQSTCQRIYDPAQCGIRIPGQEPQASARDCQTECEDALQQAGELDGYDPFEINSTGATVVLENEKQAAIWMECVDETSCEDLDDGYCAPI